MKAEWCWALPRFSATPLSRTVAPAGRVPVRLHSENIGRAHAMRHAARLKLEYDRRLFLRSIGLKV